VQEIGRAGRDGRPAHCILLFDATDLEIHERLQALSRPTGWHLARLENALGAWATEQRAPTAGALAYSAGVPARIGEVLLSDLEQAGLVERDQVGRIIVAVPVDTFHAGARDLVAKLKTFRYEGERRLRVVADYAQSEECRSVFIRRYFGEEHPPRCGTCDRCRAGRAAVARAASSRERGDLWPVIRRSLDHFGRLVVERDQYAIVAPRGEQSSIAHSAFLALALGRSGLPDKIRRLTPLVDGILRQQRKDGSYKIFFDAEPDSGEELYPAEAMLSLLDAYRLTRDGRYLDSVERSFIHYKRAYYDRSRVQPDVLVFFANWQSQAGRLLFEATTKQEVKDLVRAFLFALHDRVIERGFYDRVTCHPETQACVEVACALEGIADAYAYAIAIHGQDRRTENYRRCVLTALDFLMRAQRTSGCTGSERGGFGASLVVREQRIDVTGHVASGFIKCFENGIEGP
jgi:hypothetical protein